MGEYQHYLPQCYLKNFTELVPVQGQEAAAFIFDFQKPGKGWHRKAPRNFAGSNDFYVFLDENGIKNTEVEDFWGMLETDWPSTLKRIENPNSEVTEDDRLYIANFVASFIARVPAEIEQTKKFVEEFYTKSIIMILKMQASKPELFEESRSRYREETCQDFTPDNLLKEAETLSVHVPTPFALGLNLKKIQVLVDYLMHMSWLRITAIKDGAFITSDRPVSSLNVDYAGEPDGGGWDRKDILITFPMSHKLAMCIGWEDGKIDAIKTEKRDLVRLTNVLKQRGHYVILFTLISIVKATASRTFLLRIQMFQESRIAAMPEICTFN